MIIHLYNIHGLFRGKELEIGCDADNGGQLIYMKELASALSEDPRVTKVYIFTRLIEDPNYSADYSREIEAINDKAEIRRIRCGGKRYIAKEKLWPHLDTFVSNTITHIKKYNILPDWIHSHYADAGYVASEISSYLNVPFAHTGHSLGMPKMNELLKTGATKAELNKRYQFDSRFAAEEMTLTHAEFVITSTTQEISTYEQYNNFKTAVFSPIPPGTDTERFYPYFEDEIGARDLSFEEKQARYDLQQSLNLFLVAPDKPIILALSRPDQKKNIQGLIHAYGTDKELQAVANLAIFAGVRKDINDMPKGERETLTEILLLMDKYDLYGKIAIPKKTGSQLEIPALYRHCAAKHGVFVNVALQENFGLTTLEAASAGMPIVVTANGGPSEIATICQNGIVVDPTSTEQIQAALKKILFDDDQWKIFSTNGLKKVREHYTWESHVNTYMNLVEERMSNHEPLRNVLASQKGVYSMRLRQAKKMIVSDIDGTLILPEKDNPGLDQLREALTNRPDDLLFGLASGRNIELIREAIEKYDLPDPDFIISSVGTEIRYTQDDRSMDKGWDRFIQYRWNRERVQNLLLNVDELELQESDVQSHVKLSYYTDCSEEVEKKIKSVLGKEYYSLNLTFSHCQFLDILPPRASKGRAVRYLAQKLNIPLANVFTCGDSGNDFDMLSGPMTGVIVGNYCKELEVLRDEKNNHFPEQQAAAGVLEVLEQLEVL